MPTYTYKCTKCGKEFDLVKKLSEFHDVVKCPDDHHLAEKVISQTNFILKGTGWARDGYK